MDVGVQFLQFHGGLQINGNAHFLTVVQGLDGTAAHHKAQRAFQASVRELDVSKLLLHQVPVHVQAQLHVVQVVAVEQFSQLRERSHAFNVLFKGGIPLGQRGNLAFLGLAIYRAAAEGLLDFSGQGGILLVAHRHQGRQGREAGVYAVAQFLGPHIAVAGAAGAGIGQAAGGHDEFLAGVLHRFDGKFLPGRDGFSGPKLAGILHRDAHLLAAGLHAVQAEAAGRHVDGLDLTVRHHLYSAQGAGPQKGIHHVSRHMGSRVRTVSAFHDASEAEFLQEVHHSLRGKIVPGGAYEVGVCPDMGAEISPVLDVGEVASALAGDHYFSACFGHLFQNGYRASVFFLG